MIVEKPRKYPLLQAGKLFRNDYGCEVVEVWDTDHNELLDCWVLDPKDPADSIQRFLKDWELIRDGKEKG